MRGERDFLAVRTPDGQTVSSLIFREKSSNRKEDFHLDCGLLFLLSSSLSLLLFSCLDLSFAAPYFDLLQLAAASSRSLPHSLLLDAFLSRCSLSHLKLGLLERPDVSIKENSRFLVVLCSLLSILSFCFFSIFVFLFSPSS